MIYKIYFQNKSNLTFKCQSLTADSTKFSFKLVSKNDILQSETKTSAPPKVSTLEISKVHWHWSKKSSTFLWSVNSEESATPLHCRMALPFFKALLSSAWKKRLTHRSIDEFGALNHKLIKTPNAPALQCVPVETWGVHILTLPNNAKSFHCVLLNVSTCDSSRYCRHHGYKVGYLGISAFQRSRKFSRPAVTVQKLH